MIPKDHEVLCSNLSVPIFFLFKWVKTWFLGITLLLDDPGSLTPLSFLQNGWDESHATILFQDGMDKVLGIQLFSDTKGFLDHIIECYFF